VRTFYNSLLTIPNSSIAANAVDNMGARRYRRYKTVLGVTYDTPPEKVQAFLEAIRGTILALPGMRKDFFLVEFDGFGDFALQIFVYCFMEVPDWGAELRTRTYLNLEILRIARHLDVSFAFPTRTVHIESANSQAVPPGPRAPAAGEREPSLEELARVVAGFGPGGALSRPEGVRLPATPSTTAAGSQRGAVD
jgi:MscS family membrane protein